MSTDVKSIPIEMQNAPRWVSWQYEERKGKKTKVPYDPKTGEKASSTDPNTWGDYKAAQAAWPSDGIGFVLGDGWFGIDLDHVEGEIEAYRQGDTDNIVSKFVDTMQSYTELSPSGTGIHIICKGELPKGRRRSGNIEMYDSGRYFTVTGNRAAEYELRDGTAAVKSLYEEYLGTQRAPVRTRTSQPAEKLGNQELIDLAKSAKNGATFTKLFQGKWDGLQNSQSEADLALCNMLAFWTGKDPAQMDEIFRMSGLFRPKWDEMHGRSTYGELTISRAIEGTTEVYTGKDDYHIVFTGEGEKEKEIPAFTLDDTGNAQRLQYLFSDRLRYCFADKCWYYYDDRVWHVDDIGQAKACVDDMIDFMEEQASRYEGEALKAYLKHVSKTRSSARKEAALKEAQHLMYITPEMMDTDDMLLNTPDGVVDLKTGEILPNSPDYYMTRITGVEYSPHLDHSRWDQFMMEVFDNDPATVRYVQKALGYSMTGRTDEQVAFFCFGNGRNGKSVFEETISAIMGSYAVNIQPETIMVKKNNGGANSDVARLKGARFVTTTEPDEGARLSEGIVKQLTGGDRVTARKLYGNEFEFTPEMKLWMSTNHKPLIRGTDEGIWRRIVLIPFNVYITKPDKRLKHKLRAEASAILGWMLEGLRMWLEEGLEKPPAIQKASEDYRAQMDVVEQFLSSDYVIIQPGAECGANELFSCYRRWAQDTDNYSMSQTKFGLEVSKRFDKIKDRNGARYNGLKINTIIRVC